MTSNLLGVGKVFLGVALFAHAGLVMGEEVAWTGDWEGPDLPDISSPAWVSYRGGEVTQTEYLNIESTVEDTTACYVQLSEAGQWTVTENGVTVEAEVRVNRMEGTHAGAITLSGFGPERNRAYLVFLGDGWLQLGQNQSFRVLVPPGEFVKFRITANDNEIALYLDGDDEAAAVAPLEETIEDEGSSLVFGDPASSGGGNVDWKSLKWTDQGVFAP